jgi:hypothetical protein
LQGENAVKSIELNRPMPNAEELQLLAARYLAEYIPRFPATPRLAE